MLFSAQ